MKESALRFHDDSVVYVNGSRGLVSEGGTSASLRGLVGLGLSSDQSFLVGVNEYILSRHYPMPNGIHELHKLSCFRINVEVGVANAYHQLRLSRKTSAMLSVQSVFVHACRKAWVRLCRSCKRWSGMCLASSMKGWWSFF